MTEREILDRLSAEVDLRPLELRVERESRLPARGGAGRPDALLRVSAGGVDLVLLGEVKRDAKPATLRAAVTQVRDYWTSWADGREGPIDGVAVVVPHLSPAKLRWLADAGVGGIDLSGNAALSVPGRFFFLRDGRPSRFRERQPTAAAYRGDTSLVARTLARAPTAVGTGGLWGEVGRRGGQLSLGTVSKALARLEEDSVVRRTGDGGVEVPDTGRLLDRLGEEAPPVRAGEAWLGRVGLSEKELVAVLSRLRDAGGVRVARTGASSVGAYATFAEAPTLECYCDVPPEWLLERLGVGGESTRRFPNLRLLRTADQRAYFDPGPGLAASPVQTWLELRRGDKRQRDAADDVRRLLLDEVGLPTGHAGTGRGALRGEGGTPA